MPAQDSATLEVKPEALLGVTVRARGVVAGARRSACYGSRQQDVSLPTGVLDRLLIDFASVIVCHRRLKRGRALYRSGDLSDAVYLLRTGFVKTVTMLGDGREQVTGLTMPGEMLGMDGLASGRHASNAVVLADSEVCVVPYHRLAQLGEEARGVQRKLHRMFSYEIARGQRMMLLLGSMDAEQRIAAFLLDLSERFSALGYSPLEFLLRMKRDEIGSLLGVKLETVSRIFSKLQRNNLIAMRGKYVHIVSIEALHDLVCD